jgi:DTW domain-containing protein
LNAPIRAPDEPRSECTTCRRPLGLCLCDAIPRIVSRTGLTVLQHPRERRHPVGTARFVELGLGARVICPVRADRTLACAPELPKGTAVLFPGERAREVSEIPPPERPAHLLVLDGTWNHARRLWKANPWIAELPQVRLTPGEPSRYRIRKEPHRHYLSTVEAVVAALRALEPDLLGLDGLLAAFDRMIDLQIDWATGEGRAPRTRAGSRRGVRRLPRALAERYEDVVLVYAEWAELPNECEADARGALKWAAVRPSTCETFERYVTPTSPRAAERARALGLDGKTSCSEPEALDALHEFLGNRGVVGAWDHAPLRRLAPHLDPGRMLSLRDAYRALRGRSGGALEDVLAREDVVVQGVPIPGRAGERLGNALAMLELLRTLTMATDRTA